MREKLIYCDGGDISRIVIVVSQVWTPTILGDEKEGDLRHAGKNTVHRNRNFLPRRREADDGDNGRKSREIRNLDIKLWLLMV